MKKWINNLSFALWITAVLATNTAFARTPVAAASAASVATAASQLNSLDSRHSTAQDMAAVTAMAQGQHVRLDADGKLLPSQGTGALAAGNDHDKPQVLAFLTPYANGTGK